MAHILCNLLQLHEPGATDKNEVTLTQNFAVVPSRAALFHMMTGESVPLWVGEDLDSCTVSWKWLKVPGVCGLTVNLGVIQYFAASNCTAVT